MKTSLSERLRAVWNVTGYLRLKEARLSISPVVMSRAGGSKM